MYAQHQIGLDHNYGDHRNDAFILDSLLLACPLDDVPGRMCSPFVGGSAWRDQKLLGRGAATRRLALLHHTEPCDLLDQGLRVTGVQHRPVAPSLMHHICGQVAIIRRSVHTLLVSVLCWKGGVPEPSRGLGSQSVLPDLASGGQHVPAPPTDASEGFSCLAEPATALSAHAPHSHARTLYCIPLAMDWCRGHQVLNHDCWSRTG